MLQFVDSAFDSSTIDVDLRRRVIGRAERILDLIVVQPLEVSEQPRSVVDRDVLVNTAVLALDPPPDPALLPALDKTGFAG